MQPFVVEKNVWLQWNDEEINDKIRYWVDRWQELIYYFNFTSYGLRLSSPHLLVRAIADEIEHNDLRNAETRKVFVTELSRTLKEDPIVVGTLGVEFAKLIDLINRFDDSGLLYLNTLCVSVLPFFTAGDYFRQSVDRLWAILQNPEWNETDAPEIGRLSNALIVELLQASYHISTVRALAVALFSKLTIRPDGTPDTIFLHNVDWRDFLKDGKFDQVAHTAAVSQVMSDLTPAKRIKSLTALFDRPWEQGTVIFPVSGVRNASKHEFRTITLYNPIKHSLLLPGNPEFEKKSELFHRSPEDSPVNAAVKLPFRDTIAAAETAAGIAEEVFDWIQPHGLTKCPIEIDRNNYIVLDRDGRIQNCHSGVTIANASRAMASDGLDLDNLIENLPHGLINTTLTRLAESRRDEPLVTKFPVCLHWYRKAVEARRPEDKLLNSWIVLERAFSSSRHDQDNKWSLGSADVSSKFRIIAEYVPVREALRLMYDFGWQLYHYLRANLQDSYLSSVTKKMEPHISLSASLLKESGLDGVSRIVSLDRFIPKLPEIAAELSDRIVKEKVEKANQFYSDPEVARKEISRKHDNTRDEVVLIYRLRNSIVHHGHFDRTVLLQFAAQAVELSRSVILLLFGELLQRPTATVESIFTEAKVEYDRTIARLGKDLPVKFESFKPWGTYPRTITTAGN